MKRSAFRLLVLLFALCAISLAQQPTNLVDISGTPPTTPGFLDIKAADGNVFVRCNAASTCPVNANESGTWSVRNVGNAGGIFDTTAGATAAANSVEMGAVYNTAAPTPSTGQQEPLQLDASANLKVNCITGCSGGSTISLVPVTSGGVTPFHLVAAASTNATSLKASAGQLYGASIYNNAGYPVYWKFYNKASSPTVGTDTVVFEVAVQAGTEREIHTDEGLAFATGIAYSLTKGITDTDATAVLLSDAVLDGFYK